MNVTSCESKLSPYVIGRTVKRRRDSASYICNHLLFNINSINRTEIVTPKR